MSTISWRKPKIEIGKLGANDALPAEWIEVDTPVIDTTKITCVKGDKKEFKEEGGGIVDVFYQGNNYTGEFQLYAKVGKAKPVVDVDGIIEGDYAIRISPENPLIPGKIMDKVRLSCEDNIETASDGERWKYTYDVLKPATGNKVKPYTPDVAPPPV